MRFALALFFGIAVAIGACKGAGEARGREHLGPSAAITLGQQPAPSRSSDAARGKAGSRVGFRTRARMDQHFQKHGAEFGHVTEAEYLRLAQALRDAPLGGKVEELRRSDGSVSRFDRASGAFIAFDANGTILTFFKPNAGESYFRRQATHTH